MNTEKLNTLDEADAADLVRELTRPFLKDPKRLEFSISMTGRRLLFDVIPKQIDAPRLIGKGGAMFHSIKTILTQYCRRYCVDVAYHIATPNTKIEPRHDAASSGLKDAEIKRLVEYACEMLFEFPAKIDYLLDVVKGSTVDVTLDHREQLRVEEVELRDAIFRIFTAIGTANSRKLVVTLNTWRMQCA